MAIVKYVSDKWVGLSSDFPFPTDVLDGANLFTSDTLAQYLKVNNVWTLIPGGSGGGGTNTTTSLSGTYFFKQSIPSGVNSLFISYPTLLNDSPAPKTIVGLENNISNNIVAYRTSGHCSSGFYLDLSATTQDTGNVANVIACNSNLTGIGVTVINQIISGSQLVGSGDTNFLCKFNNQSGIVNSVARESGISIYMPNIIGGVTGYTSTGNIFTIDFNARLYQTGNITGNTTFTTKNKDYGKSVALRLFSPTGNLLTFPASWTWFADAPPANIVAGKSMIVSLTSFSTLEGDVAATYAVSA